MVISSQTGWMTLGPEYSPPPTRIEKGGQLLGRFAERPNTGRRRGENSTDADFQSVFKRVVEESSGRR
ncbi:MAG: hypothetical protein HQL76_15755 [Magnetococcales bacterium]|nr:hypothetical protein [Magnetococcales bacterium]